MSSVSEPQHLSNHHRNTLRQLFQHPVSHNIEWVSVTIGSETEFFDPPRHKDIDTQAVVDLRRMLSNAGYGTAHTG